jgi:hypothetical protein
MEENIKGRAIIVLAALSAILFVLNIASCASSISQGSARKKEMAQRMELEEKFSKYNQEKAVVIEKVKAKDKELEEEKAVHLATKKALAQEQMISQSLKEDLQKITKLKETLEEELKQNLAKKAKR